MDQCFELQVSVIFNYTCCYSHACTLILTASLPFQLFNRDAEQLESWMAPREAIIRTEEVGGSPEGAEKLVKTHENIEKSIKQQVHDAIYLIIVFSFETSP